MKWIRFSNNSWKCISIPSYALIVTWKAFPFFLTLGFLELKSWAFLAGFISSKLLLLVIRRVGKLFLLTGKNP